MAEPNVTLRLWARVLTAILLLFAGTLVAEPGDTQEQRIEPVGRVQLEGAPPLEPRDQARPGVGEMAQEPELVGAPRLERRDYPSIGVSSRSVVWILAQMHLFFGALVLAVPIFVLVIELVGLKTGDDRYDDMAHEFMKISLTAYAITALFGGSLTLALFLLYPDFMGYMMRVFGAQMLVYAVLFFLESLFLYIYYYGWDAMRYGDRKWLHLTVGLMLNGVGLTLMVVANSWTTFMMAPPVWTRWAPSWAISGRS